MEPDRRREVNVGEGVGANHEKGLGELRFRRLYAPGGAEGRIFDAVANAQAVRRAVAEVVLDHRCEVLNGDDDLGDPVGLQEIEDVLHDGLVDDGDQRLGPANGKGTQARTLATGHYDGLHGRIS